MTQVIDTAQLLIVIRGITEATDVVEELASLKKCAKHNRGKYVPECV
jgi:hypothetical protein